MCLALPRMKNDSVWSESMELRTISSLQHCTTIKFRQWLEQCVKYFAFSNFSLMRASTPDNTRSYSAYTVKPLPRKRVSWLPNFDNLPSTFSVTFSALTTFNCVNRKKSSHTSPSHSRTCTYNTKGYLLNAATVGSLVSHDTYEKRFVASPDNLLHDFTLITRN